MKKDMDQNKMLPDQIDETEEVSCEVYDPDGYYPEEYDRDRYENRVDKFTDLLHKFADIEKSNAAIAKKEADLSVYATRNYIDAEHSYIESLLAEKNRKGITPEEIDAINNRTEAALWRMKDSETEARRQTEESPYWKPVDWWKVAGIAGSIVLLGFGGWKVIPRLVA